MRNLLLFMLLVAFFMFGKGSCNFNGFGFGVNGEGAMKTENRDQRGFDAIDVAISATVEVAVADQFMVEVTAYENILPILKTEVNGNTLRLYFDENVGNSGDIKIRISAPAFTAFDISGSGNIKVVSAIRSEKMNIDVSGSGEISIPQADFGKTDCNVAGSGNISMGGKCADLEINIAGSGELSAKSLTVNTLDADISGSGTIYIDVMESIKASVAGSGDLYYTGSPSVNTNISGSGSVQKQ